MIYKLLRKEKPARVVNVILTIIVVVMIISQPSLTMFASTDYVLFLISGWIDRVIKIFLFFRDLF